MKKISIFSIAGMVVLMAGIANAQSSDTTKHHRNGARMEHHSFNDGKGKMGRHDGQHRFAALPGLTAEQQKKIDALRTPFQKDVLPLQNQIAEKKAHLRTLQTADKTDLSAINKTIDEMSVLQTTMMKKSAAHREEVRKLLTDEQRVAFDSRHHGNKRGGGHHGHGRRG